MFMAGFEVLPVFMTGFGGFYPDWWLLYPGLVFLPRLVVTIPGLVVCTGW